MSTVIRGLVRVFGGVGRVIRWSLASVEDQPKAYVVPMAGADHGPISPVRLRVDIESRRARR